MQCRLFVFAAMREVEMNYYNFAVGQPIFHLSSTCLLMDPENTFAWTTDGCSNPHRALCYQGNWLLIGLLTTIINLTEVSVTKISNICCQYNWVRCCQFNWVICCQCNWVPCCQCNWVLCCQYNWVLCCQCNWSYQCNWVTNGLFQ